MYRGTARYHSRRPPTSRPRGKPEHSPVGATQCGRSSNEADGTRDARAGEPDRLLVRGSVARQRLVFDAVGLVGVGPEAPFAVGLVVLVVALEPHHLAVALEREDVGGDAVEEPAVVADDDHAAGEAQQRLF